MATHQQASLDTVYHQAGQREQHLGSTDFCEPAVVVCDSVSKIYCNFFKHLFVQDVLKAATLVWDLELSTLTAVF